MNARAIKPPVINAIGTPRKGFGTHSIDQLREVVCVDSELLIQFERMSNCDPIIKGHHMIIGKDNMCRFGDDILCRHCRLQSIQYLKSLPSNVILSSHRDIITQEIQSEWNNYIQRLDERNQRILDLLTSPKTIAELVDAAPIYRKFPYQEPLLRYWEGIMIQQHLKELENNGQVYQIDEKFHQIKK